MDVNTLYHRTVEFFADRVNAVKDDQWDDPTPCAGWTVRDLVNHVTCENLWTVPLMEGATIEEVGDRFEGDVLGEDPIGVRADRCRAPRSSRSPGSCPAAAACTCPSARRRRTSTPCSWPRTTWSTAGTWP